MRTFLICLLVSSAAMAQDNPFSEFNKLGYGQMKAWILASAEKMPAENYNYKPTDAIRTFGQVVGHVADAQYLFCSVVLGEKNPAPRIEHTKTSKADLIAALKEAFAYCDRAYDGMTDAAAAQTVKLVQRDMPKPVVLTVNDMHMSEHYGNIVIYLRLKNIVPPSSEAAAQPPPKK
ncbi:MAG TPA: DinB family protein [Bryobacteraceae bacterium]|nr:DinB family protein [Bryobacteraceae bacterium]